jgi:1,4-dihydroxy-2-naphthoate octaprenyltransferase
MSLRQFLDIVEIRTKIVSLSGLTIGSLGAWLLADSFVWPAALLMWPAALAVDMGTTAFNTFFGYWDGSDDRRHNQERDKVLVHEGVAPAKALLAALVLWAFAAVLGLVLGALAGWWIVAAGALCLLVGFAYNAGPLPLSRSPFGELFAGGFLGWVLPIVTMLAVSGRSPLDSGGAALLPAMALLALPSFLLVASILTVNNTCDIEGDREAGRLTLSILIGRRAAARLVPALGLAGWAAAGANCLAGTLSPWGLVPLAAAGLAAAPVWRGMARRGYSHRTKGPNMGAVGRVFRLYSLGYATAIALTLFLRMH